MAELMISSSVLILAVCLLRFALRGRVSPEYLYRLWGLAALRLAIPWLYPLKRVTETVKSRFSVMNAAYAVRERVIAGTQLEPLADNVLTGRVYGFDEASGPVSAARKAAGIDWQLWIAAIWVIGCLIMAGVLLVSVVRFHKMLVENRRSYQGAVPDFVTRKVYVVDGLSAPCYFGLGTEEGIYLPRFPEGQEDRVRHVLAHEMGHVKHGDRFWGILRSVMLCYYWVNPFVWIAAVLSRRDCELACDEAAVRMLGEEERYAYARTLIGLAAEQGKRSGWFSPAASMNGGKRTVRERIRVLAKHPGRTAAMAAAFAVLAVILAVWTFTGGTGQGVEAAGTETRESGRGTEAGESAADSTLPGGVWEALPAAPMILVNEQQHGTLYVLTLGREGGNDGADPVFTDPELNVDVVCYEDAAGTRLLGTGKPRYGYSHWLTEDGLEVEILNAVHAASYRITAAGSQGTLEYLFVPHDPEPFADSGLDGMNVFGKTGEAMTVVLAEVYPDMAHLQLAGTDPETVGRFQAENVVSLKLSGADGERYENPRMIWQDGTVLDLIYYFEEEITSAGEVEAVAAGSGTSWDGYVENRLDYQRVQELTERFRIAYAEGRVEEAERYVVYPGDELDEFPLDENWYLVSTSVHILDDKPVFAEAECRYETGTEADGVWTLSLWIHKVYDGWKIEQFGWSQERLEEDG